MSWNTPRYFDDFPDVSELDGRDDKGPCFQVKLPFRNDIPSWLSFAGSDDGKLSYVVLYYSCCICAGNVFHEDEASDCRSREDYPHPYLSRSATRDVGSRIAPPDNSGEFYVEDRILYFHIPVLNGIPIGLEVQFPIVPCFADYEPPKTIPARWKKLDYTLPTVSSPMAKQAEAARRVLRYPSYYTGYGIRCCRLTGAMVALNSAHVVPKKQGTWFIHHNMPSYPTRACGGYMIENACNRMPLRRDVHRMLNSSLFTMIPKQRADNPDKYHLVTHVLHFEGFSDGGDQELLLRYHNLIFLDLEAVPPEFVFARFAWNLFNDPMMSAFEDVKVTDEFLVWQWEETRPNNFGAVCKTLSFGEIEKRLASLSQSDPRPGSKRPRDDDGEDRKLEDSDNAESCYSDDPVVHPLDRISSDTDDESEDECDESDGELDKPLAILPKRDG